MAAERAAEIPPVLSTLSVGLSTTCALAAAVAANAKDDEFVALAQQDAQRRPLSAAVLLLAESARIAAKRGRPAPQEKAETALTALWNSIDWSDLDSWNPEDQNLVQVLWHGSRITSPETVKELLSKALKEQPDILPFVITACANWVEVHDSHDWSILPGFRRRYRELPSWFPTRAVVEATVPAARVTVSDSGETDRDDAESLLAQVLWLAARAST